MRSLLLSLAVVSFGAAAHAQDIDTEEMGQALTMIENLAQRALQEYGVQADVMTLSLSQLAAIKLTIDNDESTSENALKGALEKIVSGS